MGGTGATQRGEQVDRVGVDTRHLDARREAQLVRLPLADRLLAGADVLEIRRIVIEPARLSGLGLGRLGLGRLAGAEAGQRGHRRVAPEGQLTAPVVAECDQTSLAGGGVDGEHPIDAQKRCRRRLRVHGLTERLGAKLVLQPADEPQAERREVVARLDRVIREFGAQCVEDAPGYDEALAPPQIVDAGPSAGGLRCGAVEPEAVGLADERPERRSHVRHDADRMLQQPSRRRFQPDGGEAHTLIL